MKASTRPPFEIPAKSCEADLIFVLAGGEARKTYGLQLFHEEQAPRILLSVGRFEIRDFSRVAPPVPINLLEMAGPIPPRKRHFFVLFENGGVNVRLMPVGRFGTWSEIAALGGTLRDRPEMRSLIVVSSPRHLYRVGMCCRELLPAQTRLRMVGVPSEDSPSKPFSLWQAGALRTAILTEMIKICVYRLLLWMHRAGSSRAREAS
jgi:hypothetical protein